MGLTLKLIGAFTLILGIQVINISVVTATTVDVHGFIKRMDYEPPNQGGPDSDTTQGSGTR